ncbi:hypothetical protein MGYG_08256 [Nannizzia gypsea CBS 118893]|uniref:Uncharacterized protein n=1 Tax=Arthroderma gypseum (strain ATCC MYA-4604 / CBS 118893) TaxID=535722 RepID=E4V661_ARTGP|nr:hypothetical protein MGYG_08256 [Nannizzia gypsea CBS 118893]EFR05244.1 hypothetical protein MGYG_08256 [Nannizzia gypsea CBS 118893]
MNTAWRASASGPTAPAYTPVQARRTLARNSSHAVSSSMTTMATMTTTTTTTMAPSATSTESRKRVEWPPAVRDYVQRCFVPEQQIPGITRSEMEAKLKQVITGAAETNHLESIDWASLPLPQQMIQTERSAALTSVTNQLSFLQPARTSPKRKSTDISTDVSAGTQLDSSKSQAKAEAAAATITTTTAYQEVPPWRTHSEDKRRRLENDGLNTRAPAGTRGPIVGRSTELEKRYLRLTAAPNPDNVRPLAVLRKTLDLLKRRWKQENNYGYICDQFKSMRAGPDGAAHQERLHGAGCQTQLQGLYALNLGGGHPMEFKAYRILYFIYTRNQTAINSALSDLTAAEKADPALYLDTPNMGAYLMDMFVDRERLAAPSMYLYKPDVNIRFITEELGFESDEQSARFVLDHVSEHLLQETQDGVKLLTGKCGAAFEAAKQQAFRRIDIKGQI